MELRLLALFALFKAVPAPRRLHLVPRIMFERDRQVASDEWRMMHREHCIDRRRGLGAAGVVEFMNVASVTAIGGR
jgi:hypothetical protein